MNFAVMCIILGPVDVDLWSSILGPVNISNSAISLCKQQQKAREEEAEEARAQVSTASLLKLIQGHQLGAAGTWHLQRAVRLPIVHNLPFIHVNQSMSGAITTLCICTSQFQARLRRTLRAASEHHP